MFRPNESEVKSPEKVEPAEKGYEKIKPETGMTMEDAKSIMRELFSAKLKGEGAIAEKESDDTPEISIIEQNREDGARREEEVKEDLKEKYPEDEGYTIESEVYLRDENGNIAKDPVTGQGRRLDYVVIKDGKVVDSIEVTSKTADKKQQSEKEDRVRENGGNYIKDSNGNLVEIPGDVKTRIDRRD